jgi:hypothetical protein
MNKFLQQGGVCSEIYVVSNNILAIKGSVMYRVCDATCTMMVSDFYARSVLWSDKQEIVFLTFKLIGLHVFVGRIECHRIFFSASINVLQNHNVYSKVRVMTEDNVVIVFYSLVWIIYSDGSSVFLMVKRVSSAIPLIHNGINDFLANF